MRWSNGNDLTGDENGLKKEIFKGIQTGCDQPGIRL
jgi:hypothetical protein